MKKGIPKILKSISRRNLTMIPVLWKMGLLNTKQTKPRKAG